MKTTLWTLALSAALLTACGTLNPAVPTPFPTDPAQPQAIDNIPNLTRERLVKILPAGNDRFFVVGINQNPDPTAQNTAFVRRYFVSAEGVGLDLAFAQNGQLSVLFAGQSQRLHDAVLMQDGVTQRIVMVGSTIIQGNRVPTVFRINPVGGGFSARFLNEFAGEEPTALNLTNQTPPRIVVGLQRNTGNQLRVIRLVRIAEPPEFILDTTFSGDGSQLVTVPAPSLLGFSRLQLEDLELSPTDTIALVGNGFQPNPLGGQTTVPFAARIGFIPFVDVAQVTTNIPLNRVSALALDANNRLVLTGDRSSDSGTSALAVARLNNNLSLDPTFAGQGFSSTSFQSEFQPLVGLVPLPSQGIEVGIDALGRIVVAGGTDMPGLVASKAMAVARFLPNGALDPGFGQSGRITRSEGNTLSVAAQRLELFSQNRMVAGGTATNSLSSETTLSLQRFVAP